MKVMSEEQASYIAETLADADIDEEENRDQIEFRDPVKQLGFAMIPHIITLDKTLSNGAYRAYSILHYHWQQKTRAYPSVETLSKLLDVDTATISRYLKELVDHKIITRQRRMGTSTLTFLEDLPPEYADAAKVILQERAKKRGKSLQKRNVTPRKNAMERITRQEEQDKNNPPSSPPDEKPSEEELPFSDAPIKENIEENVQESGSQKFGNRVTNYPKTTLDSSGKTGGKEKPKHKKNENWGIATAIAKVCQMDFEVNKKYLLKEASTLMESKNPAPTKQIILDKYGKGGWWYTSDWRGKQGQAPNPSTLRKEWGKWNGSEKQLTVNPDGSLYA